MNNDYLAARKMIKKVLSEEFNPKIGEFITQLESVFYKIVKKGKEYDLDLKKILKFSKKLKLFKKKKSNKVKRVLIALVIASFTALTIGLVVKSYSKVKKGKNLEEKVKLFIDSLELEKLKNNPTVTKIRNELKNFME